MRRAFAILACLCALAAGEYLAISKLAIRHETLNLYDAARQRPVAVDVAVRRDYEVKANLGLWKLPIAIISNGNTVKNTEYSFLANVLAARGYLVASIQQDLPSESDGALRLQGRLFVDQLGQALPIDIVHDHVGAPVGELTDVVDADDVGMADRTRRLRLPAKTLDRLGLAGRLGM